MRRAAATAALSLATWLYVGYTFAVYPQNGFLDWVYRYDGSFTNDFHTSQPPYHWAFSHFFGWLPAGWVEPLLLVVWIASLLVLWRGFISVAERLGASLAGAVAGGLVAIPTVFWGVGVTPQLQRITYPTGVCFALAVAALALLLGGRALASGALLGAGTLVHPDLGLLATAAIAPALLVVSEDRSRDALRFAAPWLVLALPSLIAAVTGQVGGSELSSAQRLDLLTVVRVPHHFAYDYFPPSEYMQVAAWTAVLAAAVYATRDRLESRAIAVVGAAVIAICAAGAAASVADGPLPLIAAQTARASTLLVLLGTVGAAVLLTRREKVWGAVGLVGVFLAAAPLAKLLHPPLRDFGVHRVSIVEACLVLALAGAFELLARRRPRTGQAEGSFGIPAIAALAALSIGAAAVLVARNSNRPPARSPQLEAFADVADRAHEVSEPGALFLTPPDQDVFRVYAKRGTVVEFGSSEFGRGDAEWVRRLIAVSGSARVVDPA
ncbi:MAG: DUF6798 domain-containing protein, partial [Solirubrobacterales bacterium]